MQKEYTYIGVRGKNSAIVRLNSLEWYDFRDDGEDLPKQMAYCKFCNAETSKAEMPIYMNGRPGYALRCAKCGSEYAVYKSYFIQHYVGYDLPDYKGHVNPRHGTKTLMQAMDRKAKDSVAEKRKQSDECVKNLFKYTDEEWEQFKKEKKERDQKQQKKNGNEKKLNFELNMRKINEKKGVQQEKN